MLVATKNPEALFFKIFLRLTVYGDKMYFKSNVDCREINMRNRKLTEINTAAGNLPSGVGRSAALDDIETLITTKLLADRTAIINGNAQLDGAALASFIELSDVILKLPQSPQRVRLLQKSRFYALVLKNRINTLDPSNQAAFADELAKLAQSISSIPTLNPEVTLPQAQHLPHQYTRSVEEWKNKPWRNPSRSNRAEMPCFYQRESHGSKIASVRLALIEQDSLFTEDYCSTGNALCYVEGDFFSIGDLQADHGQSSANILYRQLELVAAMNIDLIFAAEVMSSSSSKGYFISESNRDGTTTIVGTKYFYMEYHNFLTNLWFMSPSANSGAGKGATDFISWLKGHEKYGKKFLDSIGGEGSIRKDTIIFLTEDGRPLAQAAREWFREVYKDEITVTGYMNTEVKKPIQSAVATITGLKRSRSQQKKEKVDVLIKSALMSTVAKRPRKGNPSSPHSSDSDSLPSSDTEINQKNFKRAEVAVERNLSLIIPLVKTLSRDYKRQSKDDRDPPTLAPN